MTENPNRNHPPELSEQDAELLSAYLDNMLESDQQQQLERRLLEDAFLRAELEALRQTVAWVQTLPELKAPRNFTLRPEVATAPVMPKIVPRPRRNISQLWVGLASAAAVFVLFFGVLLTMGPGIGQTFSSIVSGFNPAEPQVMVAAAPTQLPQNTATTMATASPMMEVAAMQAAMPTVQEQQDVAADSAAESAESVMMASGSGAADGQPAEEEARVLNFSTEATQELADTTAMTGMAAPATAPGVNLQEGFLSLLRIVFRLLVSRWVP
jgi:hypothetical protein